MAFSCMAWYWRMVLSMKGYNSFPSKVSLIPERERTSSFMDSSFSKDATIWLTEDWVYPRREREMSYENVKKYFDQAGMGDRVVVRDHIGDTVEHAAQAIGRKPEHIVKTMSFLLDGKPALICMAGDAKVHNTKYKACFHQKAIMIPGDQVEELIGHVPGAVCPFAVREEVKVYLDISLKRFSTIYTAGGSLNSTVKLTLEELERFAVPQCWVDGYCSHRTCERNRICPIGIACGDGAYALAP